MVQELIDRELGSLVDERRFRRNDERDEFGRRKWPEERIPINMDSVRGFNVRAQIVGPSACLYLVLLTIGFVCQTHLYRDTHKGPNQRTKLWIYGTFDRYGRP
jgi:hypothetical protein